MRETFDTKTRIWETFDTESIRNQYAFSLRNSYNNNYYDYGIGLPSHGSGFLARLASSAGTVVFPLGLSESVLAFPLTAGLILHLFRRCSCSLLFRGGCQVCFVLL